MMSSQYQLIISFFLFLSLSQNTLSNNTTNISSIGINYGRLANNIPSPSQVIKLLQSQGVNKIKLYDTDSSVLTALSGSGISVTVAMPNEHLKSAASAQSFTDTWVQSNILPYYPKTLIDAIAVGNEVFVDPQNTTLYLVPAMYNVYASLVKYNLGRAIRVSSPIALSALGNSYPPSSGSFKPDLVEPVMKPMLKFLKETGSYLMANAYPFFAYMADTKTISLDYCLFRDEKGVADPNNGLVYKSLLEAQMDATYAAMGLLGFNDVKLVITETGWPSKGDENEVGASLENAQGYNGNLVRRALTGGGTPLRPNEPLNVYLFALFNENEKPGPTSERNYGLFYPNEERVYEIPLTLKALKNGNEMVNGSKNEVPTPSPAGASPSGAPALSTPPSNGNTWCVANGESGNEKLQEALDYACGEGGADCRPIQEGATCYNPNTLTAHASYAFNSYYQKNSRRTGTCNFGGAAYVVTQSPRFGNCEFPTGY